MSELSPRAGASARPVVGVIGRDVPVELVLASGARPRMLRGRPGLELGEADALLGTGIDPAARAVLAALLVERFAGLDAIVASSDSEASLRLYYLLRELRRVAPERAVPPLHLVDVLHLPRAASRAYTIEQMHEFAEVLAAWTGRAATPASLSAACATTETARAHLARLDEARRRTPRSATGAELVRARLAAEVALAEPSPTGEPAAAPAPDTAASRIPDLPVLLTGSSHDESGVVAAVEATGAAVVADQVVGGALGLDRGPTTADFAGLADAIRAAGPSPTRGSPEDRGAHARALAERSGARGVLLYARAHDEAPLWDVAALTRATGLPVAVVRDQDYAAIDAEALAAALAELREARP